MLNAARSPLTQRNAMKAFLMSSVTAELRVSLSDDLTVLFGQNLIHFILDHVHAARFGHWCLFRLALQDKKDRC